jgi:hypothetical protein
MGISKRMTRVVIRRIMKTIACKLIKTHYKDDYMEETGNSMSISTKS